jgi:hypothetical protein
LSPISYPSPDRKLFQRAPARRLAAFVLGRELGHRLAAAIEDFRIWLLRLAANSRSDLAVRSIRPRDGLFRYADRAMASHSFSSVGLRVAKSAIG